MMFGFGILLALFGNSTSESSSGFFRKIRGGNDRCSDQQGLTTHHRDFISSVSRTPSS